MTLVGQRHAREDVTALGKRLGTSVPRHRPYTLMRLLDIVLWRHVTSPRNDPRSKKQPNAEHI